MNTEDRIALHKRLSEGYCDAMARNREQGGIVLPDEWKLASDYVYCSPYFGGVQKGPVGERRAGVQASTTGGANHEFKCYQAKLPDFRAVECLRWSSEEGFVVRARFEGHTPDGVTMGAWFINFFFTNEDGEITRCEGFTDGDEYGPIVELVMGVRGPFKDFDTYWNIVAARAAELQS